MRGESKGTGLVSQVTTGVVQHCDQVGWGSDTFSVPPFPSLDRSSVDILAGLCCVTIEGRGTQLAAWGGRGRERKDDHHRGKVCQPPCGLDWTAAARGVKVSSKQDQSCGCKQSQFWVHR